MSDRLYLSCWVRGFKDSNMLRHFGKLVELFPFSRLAQRGPVLRVYALEYVEPPLLERPFDLDASAEDMIAAGRPFVQPDCSIEIDGFLGSVAVRYRLETAARRGHADGLRSEIRAR